MTLLQKIQMIGEFLSDDRLTKEMEPDQKTRCELARQGALRYMRTIYLCVKKSSNRKEKGGLQK